MRGKPKLLVVLQTLVSLGLLTYVFVHVDLRQVWSGVAGLRWPFVTFALLYYAGCQCLSCVRWQLILRAAGHTLPLRTLVPSYFAGMFLNLLLPGSLGGDVYRVYRVARKSKDAEAAFVSVFLERFTGLVALCLLSLLAVPVACELLDRAGIVLVSVAAAGVLGTALLLAWGRKPLHWAEAFLAKVRLAWLGARLTKVQTLLRTVALHGSVWPVAVGISLLLVLAIVYYHYAIAQQLRLPVSYGELLVFTPIVAVLTVLPLSLGGLGVREGLWVYLFSRIGLTAEQGLLFSLTLTALAYLMSLPGGLVLLFDSAGLQQLGEAKRSTLPADAAP